MIEPAAASSLPAFSAWVRRETGIVLSDAKRPLLEARLGVLARAAGHADLDRYFRHLLHEAGEAERRRALDALFTHTTAFFRETHHFELLQEKILPERKGSAPFRAWSAACSSGEEPYTLALCLRRAQAAGDVGPFRILATDLSESVLRRAKEGIYPAERLCGLPPAVLSTEFEPARQGHLQLVPSVRALVSFHRLNLVDERWRLKPRFDVIFCRNVLIYFDESTRNAVVARLVEQLLPGGFLALGHTDHAVARGFPLEAVGPTMYRRTR